LSPSTSVIVVALFPTVTLRLCDIGHLPWNSRHIYLCESRDVVVNWHWPGLPAGICNYRNLQP